MRYAALLLLCMLPGFADAQYADVWKKEVSHVVDTRSPLYKLSRTDSSLGQVIVNAVKTGRISAWTAGDYTHMEKVHQYAIGNLFDNCIAPGVERSTQNYERFFRDSLYQFRIFEEWTFDKAKEVTIAIKYVAPVRNVYDEYGRYRGKQALFLIGYEDFVRITKKHATQKQQFNKSFWRSHFERPGSNAINTSYHAKNGTWEADVTCKIPVNLDRDTAATMFRNERIDTPLIMIIEDRVIKNVIPAWAHGPMPFSKPLTAKAFEELVYPFTDTLVTIDPVTRNEIVQWIVKGVLKRTSHYIILQRWSFDPASGKTNITFEGFAPCDANYGNMVPIDEPIFWVKYASILPLIDQADQYFPEKSFTLAAWNYFFLPGKKPELQK